MHLQLAASIFAALAPGYSPETPLLLRLLLQFTIAVSVTIAHIGGQINFLERGAMPAAYDVAIDRMGDVMVVLQWLKWNWWVSVVGTVVSVVFEIAS